MLFTGVTTILLLTIGPGLHVYETALPDAVQVEEPPLPAQIVLGEAVNVTALAGKLTV